VAMAISGRVLSGRGPAAAPLVLATIADEVERVCPFARSEVDQLRADGVKQRGLADEPSRRAAAGPDAVFRCWRSLVANIKPTRTYVDGAVGPWDFGPSSYYVLAAIGLEPYLPDDPQTIEFRRDQLQKWADIVELGPKVQAAAKKAMRKLGKATTAQVVELIARNPKIKTTQLADLTGWDRTIFSKEPWKTRLKRARSGA
jgi:hypothetical protein